ncbi:hypothetical protein CBM2599_A120520 [Cupriavidus taiwanensis]|uniref:hypothetical protein n=1 Tax=Cupriavidus taiwanensis TaxID=164546 RepID=UPI000E11E96F|nr:hypothetical protein [Cupriavidus taiwanensis]SOY79955.1 hypothetical protein CBM2599_A120520 [Cupriavidus taiwanensis]SOY81924.1 hypothetical protein CBM2600_A120542 [Cupriavidus taiwanensis]
MKISKALAGDLRYLAAELEWDEAGKVEVRESLKANPEFFTHFWTVFAQAHRAGYRFCQATGFQKLEVFCKEKGLPDPYNRQYSGAEIDRV